MILAGPAFAADDLMTVIDNGDFETATAMINNGADVNAKNNNGLTPLHVAIWVDTIVCMAVDYGLFFLSRVDLAEGRRRSEALE